MKLWVLPTLWRYLADYWSKFTRSPSKAALTQSLHHSLEQTRGFKSPAPPIRKNAKLCKFNLNDISDSQDNSRPATPKKHKHISKDIKCKTKTTRRTNDPEPNPEEIKTSCIFIDDSGQQISSIGDKESSDSGETVKQFLIHMEPKIIFAKPTAPHLAQIRKQQAKEMMLVNQMFGHTIKNRLVVASKDLPFTMKKNDKKYISSYDAQPKTTHSSQIKGTTG